MWNHVVRGRGPPAGRAEPGWPKSPALPSWAESICMAGKSRSKTGKRTGKMLNAQKDVYERQGIDLSVLPGNNSVLCSNLRLKDRPVNHHRKKKKVWTFLS